MSCRQLRVLTVRVMAVVTSVVVATSAAGQTATPTTPWGDPDLQGIWGSSGATPMERPDTYQGRETLSDEEVAQLRQESADRDEQLLNRPAQRTEAGGNVGAYNNLWMERGLRSNRTSMLVDPPEGRFPPLTAAGEIARTSRNRGDDSWEDRHIWERCVTRGGMPNAMFPRALQQQHAGVSVPRVGRDAHRADPRGAGRPAGRPPAGVAEHRPVERGVERAAGRATPSWW